MPGSPLEASSYALQVILQCTEEYLNQLLRMQNLNTKYIWHKNRY
jgi:hypothetical protein